MIDSEASLKGVHGADEQRRRGVRRGRSCRIERVIGGRCPEAQGVGSMRDVGGGELFIEHGPIESAGMGGMTMGFKAPAAGVPPV